MGVEKKKTETVKPAATETKTSFFQNLFENLFKNNGPEAEKKRRLKAIAKSFSKTKYHNFYKCSTFEVMPPFAKLFYDVYKIIAPVQSIFNTNDNIALYKRQIINYSFSEKQIALLDHFEEPKIVEMSRQLPLDKLTAQIEADLETFNNEFTTERITKTENLYKTFSLLKDFCNFDYYVLLKKFSSKMQENNFSSVPQFEKINAEYVVEELKDFCSVAYNLLDESLVWDSLFEFIKTLKGGTELLSLGTWKKVLAKLKSIKTSQAFDLMIRHISRNPSYETEIHGFHETLTEKYIDKVQEDTMAILSKIGYAQKESKANSFCEQIFGTTEIRTLKNYTDTANTAFDKKDLNYFEYPDALNYLKAFILEYVKKDIRELYDVVVIRGQWDASLSAPMSNAYQELLKISDEITTFDAELAEEGSLGLKIKTLLPKTAHDPGAENIINRIIEDSNEQAKSYLITSTQNLVTIGKTLKQLIEDYVKPKPVLVQNWRELERFIDHPMKEFCINIYKKIYLFVQLMQQYLSE